ncbi:MAG: hypothetical protein ACFE8M_07695 [Candidatus Hermodarchaeota archaeon]
MNRSKTKKEINNKSNISSEIHQYKDKKSIMKSECDKTSQNEGIENSSEDKFDWDWIFEKGWLRTKK